ncbi:MAG: UrcA family protein [Hyphomonadaceae bacterium]|nr:UrcA family protein [Hyphomonadaceae bacterium]
MTLSKTLTTIFASTVALAMVPAVAATQSDAHVKSKEISIAGYDLTRVADAEALLTKIEAAAKSVCKLDANRETVRERMLRKSCEDEAIASALEKLDSPQVTALAFEDSQG